MPPSLRRTPGKAAATAATAAPFGASRRCTAASLSWTGDAETTEHGGGGALAHADRAGEAEDDHRPPKLSTTRRRSAGVTSGSTPNQAAKPGRA